MIIGIDVGGTHTDAVVLDNLKIVRKSKIPTNISNPMESLVNITNEIMADESLSSIERIVLSTTISTNSIVQGKIDRVGLILANGPGLSVENLRIGEDSYFVSGYVNHRGIRITGTSKTQVGEIEKRLKEKNIRHLGIVGKFSTRNPSLETEIGDMIGEGFTHLSFGHLMSGNLNFPRRIATTYLNAAIWSTYQAFVEGVSGFTGSLGIDAPIYILKADGGTMRIDESTEYPVGSILSGPAASVMGILALKDGDDDAIALDIGGTTTDIAVFADGVPLLEPLGATIAGHKTLIRGLLTRSIGIGGDSRVIVKDGNLIIGPEREGPAAALGGPSPTPTDAMIILGLTDIGDRQKALEAVKTIADKIGLDVENAARMIFESACRTIASAADEILTEINNKPVYTIHEMLEGKQIKPRVVYIVGGPSKPMAPRIEEIMGIKACVPEHSEVANAMGAALARTTTEVTLLADTERKKLVIPEEGMETTVSQYFTHQEAVDMCIYTLRSRAIKMGASEEDLDIEIIEDQSFNMVRGMGSVTGKNMRIKAQVKPGLIAGYEKGVL